MIQLVEHMLDNCDPVESGQLEAACPTCGVVAVGHGRRARMLHDARCFGRVTLLRRLVRIWRCRDLGVRPGRSVRLTPWRRRG